jgi:hypothetical protein
MEYNGFSLVTPTTLQNGFCAKDAPTMTSRLCCFDTSYAVRISEYVMPPIMKRIVRAPVNAGSSFSCIAPTDRKRALGSF